jgi:flagellar protein FlaI
LEVTTVNTLDGLDATAFFTTPDGLPTMVTGGALEQIISESDKDHLNEVDRYWAVYPYSFISIFRSTRNSEYHYYVVEPSLSDLEQTLIELLAEKLRTNFRYLRQDILSDSDRKRRAVIREQLFQLLDMYGLYEDGAATRAHAQSELSDLLDEPPTGTENSSYLSNLNLFGSDSTAEEDDFEYTGPDATTYGGRLDTDYLDINTALEGHPAFHESTTDTDDSNMDSEASGGGLTATRMTRFQFTEETDTTTLNDYHVYKVLYVLERQFVGYKKIDAIKNDVNV